MQGNGQSIDWATVRRKLFVSAKHLLRWGNYVYTAAIIICAVLGVLLLVLWLSCLLLSGRGCDFSLAYLVAAAALYYSRRWIRWLLTPDDKDDLPTDATT